VEGAPVQVDLVPCGLPGVYSLLAGGRSYELTVDGQGGECVAIVNGEPLAVAVQDALRARAVQPARLARGVEGLLTMRAPMPGLVRAVRVRPGQTVEAGETVVVLETMKMESNIAAPHRGVVREVQVAAGATVRQHQPLVVVHTGPTAA